MPMLFVIIGDGEKYVNATKAVAKRNVSSEKYLMTRINVGVVIIGC